MGRAATFKCATNPEVNELSELLKVISDPTRLRILCALFLGERCVCEIEEGLAVSQPLASHHLGVLRESGLVEVRKQGTWSYYSLDQKAIRGLNRMFKDILGEDRLSAGADMKSTYCCPE